MECSPHSVTTQTALACKVTGGPHLILVARALAVLGQGHQALHHQLGVALVHKHAKGAHGTAAQHRQELDRLAHEVDVDGARAAQVVLAVPVP